MLNKDSLRLLIPKAGLAHLGATYINWAGVGFIASWIAGTLDKHSDVLYAAYYTGAVNEAIGFKFWVLLVVIGTLLFCIGLPLFYLAKHFEQLSQLTQRFRRFIYMFFLVAFDEGALMIGILLANFMHASDRMSLLSTKSFLFSDVGLFTILTLMIMNSVLWLIGESVYNSQDQSYSGVVALILNSPLKFSLPAYGVFSSLFVYVIMAQQ